MKAFFISAGITIVSFLLGSGIVTLVMKLINPLFTPKRVVVGWEYTFSNALLYGVVFLSKLSMPVLAFGLATIISNYFEIEKSQWVFVSLAALFVFFTFQIYRKEASTTFGLVCIAGFISGIVLAFAVFR